MRKIITTACAIVAAVVSTASWAQEPTTGRVTYVDREKHQIMLDNANLYTVARDVNLANVAPADLVELGVEEQNGKRIVDKIDIKYPPISNMHM